MSDFKHFGIKPVGLYCVKNFKLFESALADEFLKFSNWAKQAPKCLFEQKNRLFTPSSIKEKPMPEEKIEFKSDDGNGEQADLSAAFNYLKALKADGSAPIDLLTFVKIR